MNLVNKQYKKRGIGLAIASALITPWVQAAEVDISGFLSVGGGFLEDEDSLAYGGYEEEDMSFNRNLLGLQVTGEINEDVSATAQMIARSSDDYDLNAEWAYLTWQATDSSRVRVGRLRTPFYMFSEYVDVGYSYAWIAPPQEVYYLPFNNLEGIDYYLTSAFGSFDASFQAYFGSFDGEFELSGIAATAKTSNQLGVAATIGRDWWTLRAAYHQAKLTVDFSDFRLTPDATFDEFIAAMGNTPFAGLIPNVLIESDDATFAEVGLNIDTGRFVAAAEYVEFDVVDSYLSKNIRQYAMVGIRVGDFLFHVTGARSEDEIAHLEEGIPLAEDTAALIGTLQAIAATRGEIRDVVSLGARWDVRSGIALKLQMDDVDDVAGEQKVFSVAVQAVF